ncbi:MAG: alpha/beta hydrolase-fold protein [Bdellovibrionota bacterium]
MKFKKRYFFILLVIGTYFLWGKFSSPYGDQVVSYHPASKECFQEEKFKYCVYKSEQGVNGNIAYYLHGRNLDESTWNDETFYTSMVQKYWQENKLIPPTVVAISYGPIWLLSPKNAKEESGLLEHFLNKALPFIESKVGTPKERILFGESMGGLNSLIAMFHSGVLFSKVASLCPGVYNISPFSSLSEMKTVVTRTGADPKIVYGILELSKKFISTEDDWDKISPLRLVEHASALKSKLYLSCGLYDQYGNYEGNELLSQKMILKGFSVEWHPLYGGHCAIDVSSLAEFLAY